LGFVEKLGNEAKGRKKTTLTEKKTQWLEQRQAQNGFVFVFSFLYGFPWLAF